MTALWDDLKKNLKEWGTSAAEKAEELGKVAATKTEEITKIGKVKLEIHQLNRDLDKNYSNLGKYVFETTENENVTNFAGNEQFFSYIKKVRDLHKQIKMRGDKVKKIKTEYGAEKSTPSDTGTKEEGGKSSENESGKE